MTDLTPAPTRHPPAEARLENPAAQFEQASQAGADDVFLAWRGGRALGLFRRDAGPSQQPATSAPGSGPAAEGLDQPITHIHGVARDPATDRVVIATHEGAFERRDGAWYGLGDVIDLMGFAITPDGTWFASGHPGLETDLPEPVGLIASTDRGQTWQVLSRGGESDFHALAAGPGGILGFDGTLRASTDGARWEEVSIPAPPFDLSIEETSFPPDRGGLAATRRPGRAPRWTARRRPVTSCQRRCAGAGGCRTRTPSR